MVFITVAHLMNAELVACTEIAVGRGGGGGGGVTTANSSQRRCMSLVPRIISDWGKVARDEGGGGGGMNRFEGLAPAR